MIGGMMESSLAMTGGGAFSRGNGMF